MKKNKAKNIYNSKRLLKIRETLGFSQRQMAEEFGVVHGAIGLWESEKRKVPGPVIRLIEIYEEELGIKNAEDVEKGLEKLRAGWLSRTIKLTRVGSNILGRVVADKVLKIADISEDDGLMRRRTKANIARKVVETFGELKGLPHKVGQLISYMDVNATDEEKEIYYELQHLTPPMKGSVIAEVIVEDFGRTPNQLFKEWSMEPFAAASIGQLHRAKTFDGRDVAVKVQYPGIRKVIEADLKNAAIIDKLGSMLIRGQETENLLEEITGRFVGECDYIREAANLKEMKQVYKRNPYIHIPEVYEKYSSRRVITMDYMKGDSFQELIRNGSRDKKSSAGEIIWDYVYQGIMLSQIFNVDPNPGNYLFPENGVVFLDYGCVKKIPDKFFGHWKNFKHAIMRDDKKRTGEEAHNMGIIVDRSKFDYDRFYKLMREWYYPCYCGKSFTFTKEFVAKCWQEMMNWRPRRMYMKFPKELLFLNQVQWGLYSVLAEMGAASNWSRRFGYFFE